MLLIVEQSCCMGCMGIWSWCMFMAGIDMATGMATGNLLTIPSYAPNMCVDGDR